LLSLFPCFETREKSDGGDDHGGERSRRNDAFQRPIGTKSSWDDENEKENENENENVFREENEKKPRENIGDVFFVRLVSIFLRARSCTRGGTVEACGDFGGDERTKS
tara:strand:+ start:914 stop:1237 length:324 start_codon:yes stop_codon:yes gene_type:complete